MTTTMRTMLILATIIPLRDSTLHSQNLFFLIVSLARLYIASSSRRTPGEFAISHGMLSRDRLDLLRERLTRLQSQLCVYAYPRLVRLLEWLSWSS